MIEDKQKPENKIAGYMEEICIDSINTVETVSTSSTEAEIKNKSEETGSCGRSCLECKLCSP